MKCVVPGKTDAPTLASAVAQDACRYDGAVLVEHIVQILLGDVGRQIGQVQVGRILFLLLLPLSATTTTTTTTTNQAFNFTK